MKSILKSISILTIVLSFSFLGNSQVYKLRSTEFSLRYKIDEYNWTEWSEASETSVLITFDITNQRITIYSKEKQVYDIVQFEGEETDSDGDDIYSYYCVDNAGLTCRVKWLKLNSQGGRMQLYIYYSDFCWLYNVYSLN